MIKKIIAKLGNPLAAMGALTGTATLITIGLILLNKPVAAAVVGTATAFFWLALVIVCVVVVTAWWTRQTMALGGELMLRGQESDDRRDSIMIREIGNLARVLMRQTQDQPRLPLPDRGTHWLPSPAEMENALDIETDEYER